MRRRQTAPPVTVATAAAAEQQRRIERYACKRTGSDDGIVSRDGQLLWLSRLETTKTSQVNCQLAGPWKLTVHWQAIPLILRPLHGITHHSPMQTSLVGDFLSVYQVPPFSCFE